jgi:hypothetical protein
VQARPSACRLLEQFARASCPRGVEVPKR